MSNKQKEIIMEALLKLCRRDIVIVQEELYDATERLGLSHDAAERAMASLESVAR